MKQIDLDTYRLILSYEKMEVFIWDLSTDTIDAGENAASPFANIFSRSYFSETLKKYIHPYFSTRLMEYIHPGYRKVLWKYLDYLTASHPEYGDTTQEYLLEFLLRDTCDEYICCQSRQLIRFVQGRACMVTGSFRNIEAHCQVQRTLLEKAERDSMTGLYNKETLCMMVNKAISSGQGCQALIVFDLDGFKGINDNLGHLMGDEIILDMAAKLKNVFRQEDIIARIGGDEFVVFLQNIDGTAFIEERCNKVRALLDRSFFSRGKKLIVGVSAGIEVASGNVNSYKEMFEHADQALYQAKRNGRNMQCFYGQDQ